MIRQDLLAMTKGALSIDEEKDLDVLLASQIKKDFYLLSIKITTGKRRKIPEVKIRVDGNSTHL
jgi:hypothetical protein